jgi:EAL domain-containing protein (putative c-di-GMP-specific phosphodiesterase class I)
VTDILGELNFDPGLLTLELTEGILLKDVSFAARQLAGLRALGIRISLDDFGTGYSSLSYLASMSADTIKLDKSFLNKEHSGGYEIIDSVVAMAHKLGMKVVAEGVETLAQSDRLKELKCDELQGFYYSRPLPAHEVAGFLDSFPTEGDGTAELAALASALASGRSVATLQSSA